MRSITRPLATAAASTLLVLSLAACGDGGDDKASDDKSPSESTSSSTTAGASTATEATDSATAATDTPTGAATAAAPGAEDLCGAITDIIKVVGSVPGPKVSEAEWKKIQDSYGALDDVDLPDNIPAKEKEGRDVAVDAITSMSYQDALKAFSGQGSGSIPGLSAEDNAKAEAFFTWAGKQCPGAAGAAGGAQTPTVPESSVSAE